MNLCKDCKHFVPGNEWAPGSPQAVRYAICGLTDRVGGGEGVRCFDMRESRWFATEKYRPYCGPNANQWEAK